MDENSPLIQNSNGNNFLNQWVDPLQLKLVSSPITLSIYMSFCMMIANFFDRILRFSVFSIPIHDWKNPLLKDWLGISTSLAMTIGMFIGIYILTNLNKNYRGVILFLSVTILCWFPSISFATDIPWLMIVGKFIGTLPEGIFAGSIVTYLEGRRKSDLYTAFYYLGSMVGRPASNSIGTYLCSIFEPRWMPLFISFFSYIPLLAVIFFITLIPPPSFKDMEVKNQRLIENQNCKDELFHFWKYFFIGLISLLIVSGSTFGWRTYRDFFSTEIYFQELGYSPEAWVYISTDATSSIVPIIMFIILNKIKSNFGIMISLCIYLLIACIMISICSGIAVLDKINPFIFLFLTSLSSYIIIPTIFPIFDRLIASSGSNISTLFLKNVSDGINNSFATLILIIVFFIPKETQLEVYEIAGWIIGMYSICLMVIIILFFLYRVSEYKYI